jgi:hypothetical protein
MRRIFVVLEGIGLQEKSGIYRDAYDHPFFGQFLVGNLLRLAGYPNFTMSQTTSSVEMAIGFPRMIMGIFAIIDTFLVFKIAQRIYGNKVALFASVLFAVSPMTWHLRLITLDNIGLPMFLTSILISLSLQRWNNNSILHRHSFLVLLSGTFLGLAILTKIPFFTMIPLVGYLIYKNSIYLKSVLPLKMIVIWLIPIIIIPSIWPLYAISVGEFDLWQKGVLGQTLREDRRPEILGSFFSIDSILLFLGLAGLVYSFVRKIWIIALWIVPFLIFVYIHGWFNTFHWVLVLPAFSIAGAKLVIDLILKLKFEGIKKSITLITICTFIAGIGFFNTFMIINLNLEKDAVRGIVKSLDYMDRADGFDDDRINENITVLTDSPYSWIYKYVFNLNNTPDTIYDIGRQEIKTEKTIIFEDGLLGDVLGKLENKFSSFLLDLGRLKKICNLDIEWNKVGLHSPITVTPSENVDSSNNIIFKTNSNSGNMNTETVDMKNTTARYINVTSLQNTNDGNDVITKISIYDKDENNDNCKRASIRKVIFPDRSLRIKTLDNYDVIASYQKLLHNVKEISEYRTETPDLHFFTQLFSPEKYHSRYFRLLSNY